MWGSNPSTVSRPELTSLNQWSHPGAPKQLLFKAVIAHTQQGMLPVNTPGWGKDCAWGQRIVREGRAAPRRDMARPTATMSTHERTGVKSRPRVCCSGRCLGTSVVAAWGGGAGNVCAATLMSFCHSQEGESQHTLRTSVPCSRAAAPRGPHELFLLGPQPHAEPETKRSETYSRAGRQGPNPRIYRAKMELVFHGTFSLHFSSNWRLWYFTKMSARPGGAGLAQPVEVRLLVSGL